MKENVIEWLTGQNRITVTLSQRKLINKIKILAEIYPNEVEIVADPSKNEGYLLAHIPLEFLKLLKNNSKNGMIFMPK